MTECCLNKFVTLLIFAFLLHPESSCARLWQPTGRDSDLRDQTRWTRPTRESFAPAESPLSSTTQASDTEVAELDRNRGLLRPLKILDTVFKNWHALTNGQPGFVQGTTGRENVPVSPTRRPASHRPNVESEQTTRQPEFATERDSDDESETDNDQPTVGHEPSSSGTPSQVSTGQDPGSCRCVPFYQCVNGKIVKDGSGIIDPRVKEHEVPTVDKLPASRTRTGGSTASQGRGRGGRSGSACGPFSICCRDDDDDEKETKSPKCGARLPKTPKEIDKSRILTPDGASSFGSWPWQAAILKFDGQVNTFQCGGTLIDHLHVLTVAHCLEKFVDGIENINELIVRLGEYDTSSRSEPLPHEDFAVRLITIHHAFRNTSLWNDIALIRLSAPVSFKAHIEPVCLPSADDRFNGYSCATTGWGQDAYKGGVFSNVLKEAHVPVVDRSTCQDSLRRTRLGTGFRLHDSFICAGGKKGVDSCRGDGGGPLVCYSGNSYKLAGLVSWGIECGHSDVPGVYVNIPLFVPWIRDHIRSEDDWGSEDKTSTFVPVEGSRIALPPAFKRNSTHSSQTSNSRSRVGLH